MPRRRFKSWSVELPDFWSEEGPITDNQAQFVGPKGVRLRLIVTWARPPQPVETTLHKPVGAHQRQLIETMPGVELSPPEASRPARLGGLPLLTLAACRLAC